MFEESHIAASWTAPGYFAFTLVIIRKRVNSTLLDHRIKVCTQERVAGAVVAGCPQKIVDYTPTACSKEETITEEASGSSRPVLKTTTMKAGPRTQCQPLKKNGKKLFKDFQHGEFSGTGRVDTLRPSHRLTGPWMHGQTGTRPDQCKIPSLAPMAHFLIGVRRGWSLL
ncbi:unnamed protein product [Acanthoscelides obtectus]|uniref:Uncharacterized protein n=1 Tax=Acanthoscelides obtectus TaxID=200917 RepID=A0A9P0MG87_ACAOB|nr:unnamed protein product [Acanthoscelides obtectus]CAK1624167.1 hypothetical protein AOBTE_LOCUS2368 [Acanthoscelides obtectus]